MYPFMFRLSAGPTHSIAIVLSFIYRTRRSSPRSVSGDKCWALSPPFTSRTIRTYIACTASLSQFNNVLFSTGREMNIQQQNDTAVGQQYSLGCASGRHGYATVKSYTSVSQLHFAFIVRLLGPFHGAIAVPSVTRCRCRRCRGHRCAGGARQYR